MIIHLYRCCLVFYLIYTVSTYHSGGTVEVLKISDFEDNEIPSLLNWKGEEKYKTNMRYLNGNTGLFKRHSVNHSAVDSAFQLLFTSGILSHRPKPKRRAPSDLQTHNEKSAARHMRERSTFCERNLDGREKIKKVEHSDKKRRHITSRRVKNCNYDHLKYRKTRTFGNNSMKGDIRNNKSFLVKPLTSFITVNEQFTPTNIIPMDLNLLPKFTTQSFIDHMMKSYRDHYINSSQYKFRIPELFKNFPQNNAISTDLTKSAIGGKSNNQVKVWDDSIFLSKPICSNTGMGSADVKHDRRYVSLSMKNVATSKPYLSKQSSLLENDYNGPIGDTLLTNKAKSPVTIPLLHKSKVLSILQNKSNETVSNTIVEPCPNRKLISEPLNPQTMEESGKSCSFGGSVCTTTTSCPDNCGKGVNISIIMPILALPNPSATSPNTCDLSTPGKNSKRKKGEKMHSEKCQEEQFKSQATKSKDGASTDGRKCTHCKNTINTMKSQHFKNNQNRHILFQKNKFDDAQSSPEMPIVPKYKNNINLNDSMQKDENPTHLDNHRDVNYDDHYYDNNDQKLSTEMFDFSSDVTDVIQRNLVRGPLKVINNFSNRKINQYKDYTKWPSSKHKHKNILSKIPSREIGKSGRDLDKIKDDSYQRKIDFVQQHSDHDNGVDPNLRKSDQEDGIETYDQWKALDKFLLNDQIERERKVIREQFNMPNSDDEDDKKHDALQEYYRLSSGNDPKSKIISVFRKGRHPKNKTDALNTISPDEGTQIE